MSDKTSIEWADATWNPIRARTTQALGGRVGWHCEIVSPGCENCYAQAINRRLGTGMPYLRQRRDAAGILLDDKILAQPLRWRRSRRIFVCSMSDLFGEWVSDEVIDRVMAIAALCPQHTFQVLTKRAERMREYMTAPMTGGWAGRAARVGDDGVSRPMTAIDWRMREAITSMLPTIPGKVLNYVCERLDDHWPGDGFYRRWPLPNVWLGVSAEDQRRADERIPELLATPAAVRFVSAEPLLGPVDFERIHNPHGIAPSDTFDAFAPWGTRSQLDWVIVGGESGLGARPMHPDWARSVRDQCVAAGVPFFFKQHGEWIGTPDLRMLPGGQGPGFGRFDHCRYDMDHEAVRVGKRTAGRLLDGREWAEFPA